MPKLKGKIIGTLDNVEESLRGYYVAPNDKDGKELKTQDGQPIYILDTEDMEHKDDIQGLKNALETERAQNNERQAKITASEASIANLTADLEFARKNNKTEADINAVKEQMRNEHEKLTKSIEGQRELYRNSLDRVVRIDAARAAITSPGDGSKRTKGSAELLLPHVLDRTKFEEIKDVNGNLTGQFKVVVVNDQGIARIGDSQGNPMTIDQLLDEMFGDSRYSRAFEPVGGGGSGADNNTQGSGGGKRTISRTDQEALNNSIEQIASGEVVVTA